MTQTLLRLLLLSRLRLRLTLQYRIHLLHLIIAVVLLERVGLFVLEDANPAVYAKIRLDVSRCGNVVDVEHIPPQFKVSKSFGMYLIQEARKLLGGSTLN